jgi:hypothetical protein
MPQPFLYLRDISFMGEGENGPIVYAFKVSSGNASRSRRPYASDKAAVVPSLLFAIGCGR